MHIDKQQKGKMSSLVKTNLEPVPKKSKKPLLKIKTDRINKNT